jgi:hypothetical protein
MTENVFGVSSDGTIIWQIERNHETVANPNNQYVDVRPGSPGTVIVGNWNGTDAVAEVATGRVVETHFTK